MARRIEDLPDGIRAIARARALGAEGSWMRLPFGVTRHFLSLARPEEDDPILRQCLPDAAEAMRLPYEGEDPLGADSYSIGPRLVHQYPSRALLLANGICAGYCRFCFRGALAGRGWIPAREATRAADYLGAHPEAKEVLVSGGDPLAASDGRIGSLLKVLRAARPDIIIRIGTRMPAFLPSRFTESLIGILRAARPLWLVCHFNHPRELSGPSLEALGRLAEAGLPLLNQSVLLRGVNDKAEVLAKLMESLARAGVKPYYLFVGDLAVGTSHLRVGLEEALGIYGRLEGMVSGLALPALAVDIPGGGGKLRLHPGIRPERRDGFFVLRSAFGREGLYPDEGGSSG